MDRGQVPHQQKTGLELGTRSCSHEMMRMRLRCRRHSGVSFLSMSCKVLQQFRKGASGNRMASSSSI